MSAEPVIPVVAPAASVPGRPSKGRILVVDDDRLVLATVTHGLAEAGFDVAQTLRDAYRIPFIFLSAFADEATLAEVRRLGALAYLVKPLDVGQIVPVVEAAFARLGAGSERAAAAVGAPGGATAAPAVAPAVAPARPDTDPGGEVLALAVGILMHRHGLGRRAATERLQRMAVEHGLTPAAQAERLVAAVEELARSGG